MKNRSFIIISLITILVSILSFYFTKIGKENNANSNTKIDKKSVVVYEIIPKEPYTDEDIDFTSTTSRAYKEQHSKQSRPLIANDIDVSKYNKIYLGYPIWWGTNPKIILTFIDQTALSNKEIIPFCTSGGTDITGSISELRRYKKGLNIKDGKRLNSLDSDETILDFINNY